MSIFSPPYSLPEKLVAAAACVWGLATYAEISNRPDAPKQVSDPYKIELANKLKAGLSERMTAEQNSLSLADLRVYAAKQVVVEYDAATKALVKKEKSSPYYKIEPGTIKIVSDPTRSQLITWALPTEKQVESYYTVDRIRLTPNALEEVRNVTADKANNVDGFYPTEVFRLTVDSCLPSSSGTQPTCTDKETAKSYFAVDPAGKLQVLKIKIQVRGFENLEFNYLDEVLPPEKAQKTAPAATEKKSSPTNTTLPARPEKTGSEKNSKLGWNGVKPVGIVASLPVTQNRPSRSGSHFNCG